MLHLAPIILFLATLHQPAKVTFASGTACGTFAHCAILTWNPSAGAMGYNAFEGPTAGGESTTPINSSPITATTYTYQITPTASVQNLFFYVEAVETSGNVTLSSVPSNEVSGNFPGLPPTVTLQPLSIPQ